MNTLKSMFELQASTLDEPAAKEALKDAEGRVVSMMTLYDKLYRSVEYSAFSIKGYLGSLVDEVIANFPGAGSIAVEKQLEDFSLDARVMQSIGIIVNELLTNIMKYAFKGRQKGSIRVSASMDGARARITVEDDGPGVPQNINFDNSPGFGLMLVRTLTEQIGGTIRMERNNGTIIVLEFDR
jgi:two-component sensor histidine kinase